MGLEAAAVAFFLLHLLPSTPARPKLVAALGEKAYLALFSLVSVAAIFWLAREFSQADYGSKLWQVPQAWLWVKVFIVGFAFVLIVGANSTPNPSTPNGEKVLQNQNLNVEGVFVITRHPLMWGIALWAGAHAISQATPRALVFFGAFCALALIGAFLQERRKRKSLGAAFEAFAARTSFFPFAALIEGRTRFRLAALGPVPIIVALILLAAILHFHESLFGVPPLPR